MLDLIRRSVRKPPHVVAYRAWQHARLAWLRQTEAWPRLERRASSWAAATARHHVALIATDARAALAESSTRKLIDVDAMTGWADRIEARRFSIFGAPLPDGPMPWSEDWRYGRQWPPAYFGDYEFYEHRDVGYDVKYPWELSRLGFLLPLAQAACFTGDERRAAACMRLLREWRAANPVAASVNWYPMEASMRTVALVLTYEMLVLSGAAAGGDLRELAALIAIHGEFVERTLEYTDIRGNHYTANIVALLLAGLSASGYTPAAGWVRIAAKAVAREIELQLLPDGVDFEKSTSYHRLVVELLLLAAIALERAGNRLPEKAIERLRRAVEFTKAYIRPDGLAPNIGDNDDGRILLFDDVPARDHRPLASLGSCWLGEAAPRFFSAAIPMFLGQAGVDAWKGDAPMDGTRWFRDGGYVVARGGGNYLMIDAGEVGLAGRGGHGHNDLLSFELTADGVPLLVDAGSYLYTGDLAARTWFQSTAAHNTLRIDRREIAAIRGPWAIDDTAHPRDVDVIDDGAQTIVRASHDGYAPAIHRREFSFARATGKLRVSDAVDSERNHHIERFLHFAAAASVALEPAAATVGIGSRRWIVRWPDGSARIESAWVSESYGTRAEGPVLVLENEAAGSWSSWFEVSAA